MVLRLRHNYQWRVAPGALYIVGIDTGAGPMKLNGDEGVLVGNVEKDLDAHSVRVDQTINKQHIYADDPNLVISGSNFNEIGNTLRFSNGILGNNVNYTVVSTSEEKRRSPSALSLDPTGTGERTSRTCLERRGDDLLTNDRKYILTTRRRRRSTGRIPSHEFHIKGEGFPSQRLPPSYS